ncbi:MAG: hypothetical protein KIT39_03360, partial [Nitrospirales bacterium]|nr:hypothetical protein [Nitrospirales bacterium]
LQAEESLFSGYASLSLIAICIGRGYANCGLKGFLRLKAERNFFSNSSPSFGIGRPDLFIFEKPFSYILVNGSLGKIR